MSASSLSLEKLEKICSKNPTSILFARLAEGFLQKGHVKRAAEIARQGLRYRPSYVAGHVVMGKCYLAVGHFEEARQEFQKVLQLDSDHPAALWHLGQIDLQFGWADLALRHFELALILDPLNQEIAKQIAQLKVDVTQTIERVSIEDEQIEDVESLDVSVIDEDVETVVEEMDIEAISSTADAPRPELVVDKNLASLVSALAQGESADSDDKKEKPVQKKTQETHKMEAIATATLAELYVQQGLVEQAVVTLKQVLLRDPDNDLVQARLEALQS
jgi:tetratricopeptide (TPR) repeat protein